MASSGAPRVERGARSWIRPERPSEHITTPMFLSAFDIRFRWFHYTPVVFFYKLEGPKAFEEAVKTLKASLSKALLPFFPWAGRLFYQADGRLALDCNDAGVEFLEASIDLPFSFLQVTKFPGGDGMALGVTSSHVVADGSSSWSFLKSWGECARGLEMSTTPIHMREELCLKKLIKPSMIKEGLSCAQGGEYCLKWPRLGELTQHDFHFSRHTLMKLKNIASKEEPCSTFQALVAHIWKHASLARDLKEEDYFGLSLIADCRARLNPPLPQDYFGNVVLRNYTKAKARDLQKEGLEKIVKRIQEVISSFDDRLFRTFGGALELLPTYTLLERVDMDTPTLSISGSPKLPFYDVEFGWGKPLCVRCPCIRGDGEAFLWMGKELDGSIDVSLGLNLCDMERLKLDKTFLLV